MSIWTVRAQQVISVSILTRDWTNKENNNQKLWYLFNGWLCCDYTCPWVYTRLLHYIQYQMQVMRYVREKKHSAVSHLYKNDYFHTFKVSFKFIKLHNVGSRDKKNSWKDVPRRTCDAIWFPCVYCRLEHGNLFLFI